MTNRKTILLMATTIAALSLGAIAPAQTVFLRDAFNHTPNPAVYPATLHNVNTGTTGLNAPYAFAWQTSPANSTAVGLFDLTAAPAPNTPMVYTYPGVFGGTGGVGSYVISQRAIATDLNINSADNPLFRQIPTQNSGPIYVSFLFRYEAGSTVKQNTFMKFWLDNVTTGTHTTVPGIGTIGTPAAANKNSPSFFTEVLAAERVITELPTAGAVTKTFFLVGKVEKVAPSTTYNRMTLWVDPGVNDEFSAYGGRSVSNRAANGGLSSITHVGFRTNQVRGGDQITISGLRLADHWLGIFPEAESPLAVELESFTVSETQSGDVSINWVTSAEIDNAGFNVYRVSRTADSSTGLDKVNATLIPAQGSETAGASYSIFDTPLADGEERTYILEDVEIGGATQLFSDRAVRIGEIGVNPASSVQGWLNY